MNKVWGCQWLELKRKQTGCVTETWQGQSGGLLWKGLPRNTSLRRHMAPPLTNHQTSILGQNRDSVIGCLRMTTIEKTWGFISGPHTSRFHKDERWFEREVRWGCGGRAREGLKGCINQGKAQDDRTPVQRIKRWQGSGGGKDGEPTHLREATDKKGPLRRRTWPLSSIYPQLPAEWDIRPLKWWTRNQKTTY